MRVAATATVESRPETVFDAMADARNEPRWNSRVSSAALRSGEPIGLGSKFAIVNGGTSYDVTITTYDRPAGLVFEAVGNPDVTIAYTFRSSGECTEMASAFDFRPNGRYLQAAVRRIRAADPTRCAKAVRIVQDNVRELRTSLSRGELGRSSRTRRSGDIPTTGSLR